MCNSVLDLFEVGTGTAQLNGHWVQAIDWWQVKQDSDNDVQEM